ncbi:MAG: single-stranded DNA-binding protein [Bacteroidota bacterium]
MSSLKNKVSLIGRVGVKPEAKTVAGGYVVAKFSLATNERKKDKTGAWQDVTQWHNLIAWGKTAESIAKFTDKGVEIAIEGKLINNNYETKEGEKRYTTEIEVSEFVVFTPKTQEFATTTK